jgi:hypothetical protein
MIFGCLQTSRVVGDKTIYVGDKKLRVQVLMAASMKMPLMMEAVKTSETSVYFNETTRRYITKVS